MDLRIVRSQSIAPIKAMSPTPELTLSSVFVFNHPHLMSAKKKIKMISHTAIRKKSAGQRGKLSHHEHGHSKDRNQAELRVPPPARSNGGLVPSPGIQQQHPGPTRQMDTNKNPHPNPSQSHYHLPKKPASPHTSHPKPLSEGRWLCKDPASL